VPEKIFAIIGSESLMGRELREVLAETPFRHRVKLIGAPIDSGVLSGEGDEAVLIAPLEEDSLRGAQVALLAGTATSAHKAFDLVSGLDPAPSLIDLTFSLEDRPQARLRAPIAEPEDYRAPAGSVHIIAHPAAAALALLLNRLHDAVPLTRSVIQILEPASERGLKGLHELQKQSVGLLSFQKLPQEVFDAQLGFNLLPRYGTEALEPLENFEMRIERHLAALLSMAGKTPMPSLRLVQAPVFHGYSMSAWIEFESKPDADQIGEALASAEIEVRRREEEPHTNVGVAGQSGIAVSVQPDRNDARACWFWIVADNLRLAADNAVAVARRLVEVRE
jgi:aspartate-semialdehyde dehydrogenase